MQLRDLRIVWDGLSPQARKDLFASLSTLERHTIVTSWEFLARHNQLAPAEWGKNGKQFWIVNAGRGFGKTRTGAEETLNYVEKYEGEANFGMVAAISSDARDVMYEGPSGLLVCAERRGLPFDYTTSKGRIEFKNGAKGKSFSAEKPNRLRGPQHGFVWCDEVSSWERDLETWNMMKFGLRLGTSPRCIVTTTPKPRELMKKILTDPRYIVTTGSLYDNIENLAPTFVDDIMEEYEGTRLGEQEIYGKLLLDNPGALWQPEMVEPYRVQIEADHGPEDIIFKYNLIRIVVAIDPAVSTGENADETGIVVVAQDEDGHYYVLDDVSGHYTPNEWGNEAIRMFDKWKADRVIAEINQGGQMVEHVLRGIRRDVPYRGVRATKGKRVRAEPIAALYEQGKCHHVGLHNKLEDQMFMFAPDTFDGSPDRVDALVWGLSELSQGKRGGISFL